MYPLISVADEVLRISKRDDRLLTPMKLMKLTYISFGWYIANYDQRLFPERIEAWRYGPVMPRLYHTTKEWGRDSIPFDKIDAEQNSIDGEGSKFLKLVLDAYGHLTGIQLSQLTHQDGSPWHQVYRPNVLGIEIPQDVIHKYYKGLLNAANQGSAT